jgi:hypothetical protein
MDDPGHGSQVRSCSGEPPRGDQDLGRVRTLTATAWARAAPDDHRGAARGGRARVCDQFAGSKINLTDLRGQSPDQPNPLNDLDHLQE